MNLNNAKSMLAQSVTCELDMLQKGEFDCANKMLQFRKKARLYIYAIECLLDTYPAQNKTLVEYLFEQVKELTYMITQNNC